MCGWTESIMWHLVIPCLTLIRVIQNKHPSPGARLHCAVTAQRPATGSAHSFSGSSIVTTQSWAGWWPATGRTSASTTDGELQHLTCSGRPGRNHPACPAPNTPIIGSNVKNRSRTRFRPWELCYTHLMPQKSVSMFHSTYVGRGLRCAVSSPHRHDCYDPPTLRSTCPLHCYGSRRRNIHT